ncbi:hypothetical protein ACFQY5_07030 [Paeniroseomonas aquatica]|uniref:Integral membrane protein n=1 Tax=Paeniroseomonas aquatica TaxID=373043 RepID=A0ABT8AAX1_9PROT|nr:hypothetical protein [Paeniroseomonas aquatica]MDN3566962.1 hypothetical protein [Paeniroseomonas aquatica]
MEMILPSVLLRRALLLDAACSGGMGLVLALAAAPLGGWFHLPEALLREAGLFLLAFAAALGWLGSRPAVPRWAVLGVIIGNALWAIDSVLLLLPGWIAPNWLGVGFILAQALIVAALAELEYAGLRRSARAVTA